MNVRTAVFSLTAAVAIGWSAGAFAQGASGGSSGAAATVSGSEVRAGESRNLNTDQGVTTGSSTLRPVDRGTAVTPNGTRVDSSSAPGGLVGRDAPDANAAAPAGR